MKNLLFLLLFLWSCSSKDPRSVTNSSGNEGRYSSNTSQQINLTILLDLSDRIALQKNPEKPEHFERDSALICYLTEYFMSQMKSKGTYLAKGKMRVVFHPNPPDASINQAAKNLGVDLSRMDTKAKKAIYENLQSTVAENISNIYKTTIIEANWPGSDIWRFFKNDVKEIAVDRDSTYRNLLVLFTDGYIFHEDSKDNVANRFAYILPGLLDKYGLRNENTWSEKMDKLDFGLISKRSDLDRLEVLVLEISPSRNHKNDEDVIRKIMDKWFSEMKVKKWKILNSDLPAYTKQKIENFLND